MHLTRLQLQQFRSYAELELTLTPGLTLFVGPNTAGKSNLLEAVYMLAALRSPRASTEGELLRWDAPRPQVARIAGGAERADGPVEVEIALAAREDARGAAVLSRSGAPLTTKRIRVNGLARRASAALGAVQAVLFTTLDIEILAGAPQLRRRYLDFTIGQSHPQYAPAVSHYQRAVSQRNALLKRIRAGEAAEDELAPWDEVLTSNGGQILAARAEAIADLAVSAAVRHHEIAPSGHDDGESADLALRYLPALGGVLEAADGPRGDGEWSEALASALSASRRADVASATTQVGPHRDDFSVSLAGHGLGAYGSRAQQRSAALALRLAEADLLRGRSGEAPIVLLDDLFSELDTGRREATAEALAGAGQLILTTADPATIPPGLPLPEARYSVQGDGLRPAD